MFAGNVNDASRRAKRRDGDVSPADPGKRRRPAVVEREVLGALLDVKVAELAY
jgi:hypothetical protein